MHADDLVRHGLADANLPLSVREAEIDIKYSGYLQRQQQQIDQVACRASSLQMWSMPTSTPSLEKHGKS